MTAKCMTCDTLYNWRAQGGARLSEFRCRCGGSLELAKWRFKDSKWESGTEYIGRKTGRVGHWTDEGLRHPLMETKA